MRLLADHDVHEVIAPRHAAAVLVGDWLLRESVVGRLTGGRRNRARRVGKLEAVRRLLPGKKIIIRLFNNAVNTKPIPDVTLRSGVVLPTNNVIIMI